jgi:hypothetical protein
MKLLSIIFTFVCLFILISCSSQNTVTKFDKEPELIKKTPLTSYSGIFKDKIFDLKTRLLISEEGTVVKVDLQSTSGDKEWDEMATKQIKEWKYTPAILDGKPISIWFVQSIKVNVLESYQMYLSEIRCKSLNESDSIYSKIKSGADFGLLARQYSVSESSKNSGYLGLVDVRSLPESVQSVLLGMKVNEVSKPIKVGDLFYIYKKFENEIQ